MIPLQSLLWLLNAVESGDSFHLTLGGATIALIAKTIWSEVKKDKSTNKAGDKPIEYYDAKFAALDEHGKRQTAILEKQNELMQKQIELLTELVVSSRIETRSRGASAGHD